MDHLLESLSHRLKADWRALLLVAGLLALSVTVALWMTRHHHLPATEEEAKVIRFGAYGSETGPRPVVVVRLRDGQVRQLSVHRARIGRCQAGGTIRIVRQGNAISVSPMGCTPSPS